MTIKQAIECRHTVRRYTKQPIPEPICRQLCMRIAQNNADYGINLCLVTENIQAFGMALRLFLAKGVRNYIILAANDTADAAEKIGYCGADIMLFAQTLGLNSWWVGGTFSRKGIQKNAKIAKSHKIYGIIALGYGAMQGTAHKSKKPEEISHYEGAAPEWFTNGIRALLLAPTALNKQAFTVLGKGNQIMISCDNGIFSGIDLGIGKYHFEVGAGKENFQWKEPFLWV